MIRPFATLFTARPLSAIAPHRVYDKGMILFPSREAFASVRRFAANFLHPKLTNIR
jgi:hypothetical protein